MRIHLIAIGGSVMHNMALALKSKGYNVTGSDDNIFEPSRSRLEKAGILPKKMGWFPEKISVKLDAIILGMHARIDNPELNVDLIVMGTRGLNLEEEHESTAARVIQLAPCPVLVVCVIMLYSKMQVQYAHQIKPRKPPTCRPRSSMT